MVGSYRLFGNSLLLAIVYIILRLLEPIKLVTAVLSAPEFHMGSVDEEQGSVFPAATSRTINGLSQTSVCRSLRQTRRSLWMPPGPHLRILVIVLGGV